MLQKVRGVDKNAPLGLEEIPDFIHRFLSSKYIANFLGFFMPNLDDIREFLINRLESIELGFIRLGFSNFEEHRFQEGFENHLSLDELKVFLCYLLRHYEELKEFFKKKEELFYIELHFQLPFIHRSPLTSAEKKMVLEVKKSRYYNTFRQFLRGAFLILPEEEDITIFLPKGAIAKEIPLKERCLKFYLTYPSELKDYWDFVLGRLMPF